MGKDSISWPVERAEALPDVHLEDPATGVIGHACDQHPYLCLPENLINNAPPLRKSPFAPSNWVVDKNVSVKLHGAEVMAVVGCVAAITDAYERATDFLHEVQRTKQALGAQERIIAQRTNDLEISLARGREVVQSQYDREFKKLGQPFATGDQIAVETLKDIVNHLERQVITNLSAAWQYSIDVDLVLVQDVSDESQDRTIICLMQLTQRLLAAAPTNENVTNFSRRATTPFADVPSRLVENELKSNLHGPAVDPPSDKHFGNHVEVSAPGSPSGRKKTTNLLTPFRQRPNKSTEIAPFDSMPVYSVPTEKKMSEPHIQTSAIGIAVPIYSAPIEKTVSQPHIQSLSSLPLGRLPPSVEDYHELVEETRRIVLESPATTHRQLSRTSSFNSHGNIRELDIAEYEPWSFIQCYNEPTKTVDHPTQRHQRRHSSHGQLMPEALQPRIVHKRRGSIHHQDDSPILPRRPTAGSSDSREMSPLWTQDEYDSTAPTSATSQSGPFSPYLTGYNSQESVASGTQPAAQKKGPSYGWMPPKAPQRIVEHGSLKAEIASFPMPPQVPPRAPSRPTAPTSRSQPITPRSPSALTEFPRRSTTSSMTSSQISSSQSSMPSVTPTPTKIVPPKTKGGTRGYLPGADNEYAGFCKGTWRAQIGETKKAWEDRVRPATLYSKVGRYYKCKSCAFEGRCVSDEKGKPSIDKKVYGSHGILYRWEFLFKSHIHMKNAKPHTVDSTFGCMFCCAEGKGTPIFEGVANLMAHLQEHRVVQPEGEVLYRTNCVVGRSPVPEEDFDVALPPKMI